MSLLSFIVLLSAGVSAGLLSSLFGLGGGLTIIPALVFCLPLFGFPPEAVMHVAIGTGLFIMLFNSLNSTRMHHKKQKLNYTLISTMFPALLLGCLMGTLIAAYLNDRILMLGFLLFILVVLIKSSMKFFTKTGMIEGIEQQPIPLKKRSTYALITGVISSCTGGGSSLVMLPVLKHHGATMKEAAGTVNALNIFIAVVASISYGFLGSQANYNLPDYTTGFIYWPAFGGIFLGSLAGVPLGTYLAHKLPEKILEIFFFAVVIIIFILMLLKFIHK